MCIYTEHLLIHLSIDGHLDCFYILVIIHNVDMNTGVHVSFQLKVCTQDLQCWLIKQFYFKPVYTSTKCKLESLFSRSSPTLVNSLLFDNSHSDNWEVKSHSGFVLHFPDGQ